MPREGRGEERRRSLISLGTPLLQAPGNCGGGLTLTLELNKHTMYLRCARPHSKQGGRFTDKEKTPLGAEPPGQTDTYISNGAPEHKGRH